MGYSIFDKAARKAALKRSSAGDFSFADIMCDEEKYLKRLNRRFKTSDTIDELRRCLDASSSLDDLVDFSLENDLCDYCDFSGLKFECARALVSVVVECCFRYPLLRAVTCFIGSAEALLERMKSAAGGNEQITVQFGIEGIMSSDSVKKLAASAVCSLETLRKRRDEYLAFAFNSFGIFDALVLDSQDFGGVGYKTLNETLKYNVIARFHPVGCDSVEAIVCHEVGHLLDEKLQVSSSAAFAALKKEYAPTAITENLSQYAAYNGQEMLAEGFAEYLCNKNPRPLARRIGEMIDAANDAYLKGEK